MAPRQGPGVTLPALVGRLTYKPGWRFRIGGPLNRYLCVFATTPDSGTPQRSRCTQHMFEMPVCFDDEPAAARWVFGCVLQAELHEAGEFFAVDDFRPHYPHHEDEGSPYELVDRWETRCR